MERYTAQSYDVVVIGAGHAGCEAALACARMGCQTLALTMNLDSVALMACNPAIGGTSKGHLVREIDALGGEMGLAADDTLIQSKLLNTGKGAAVQSLRAQMDKRRYHERMKRALEEAPNLDLKQGEAVGFDTQDGAITGVLTATGAFYPCRAIVIATGVYLNSRIIIGEASFSDGPCGLKGSYSLSSAIEAIGHPLRRFKTGTPARVHKASLDFEQMEPQYGDERILPFSFKNDSLEREQQNCYLTYTNHATHEIILANLSRAPMYSGTIKGTGARYCPSIEDKVVRFKDKPRHQLFIEPEGLSTNEMYVQGMSTSLPEDVQLAFLRTIKGLERVKVMRPAYAIEYDCIDSTSLSLSLESRVTRGAFFAGQINGSSGYEEAAAQGLMAGINAASYIKGVPPLVLDRSDGYIGVLIDDLVTKGTNEPYRMMTSRAEYRLLLRQDNADVRLTEKGARYALADESRLLKMHKKRESIAAALERLKKTFPDREGLSRLLASRGESVPLYGVTLYEVLKRPGVCYADLAVCDPSFSALDDALAYQVEVNAKYEGYIQKQYKEVEQFRELEAMLIPEAIDYNDVTGLRIEARQKLSVKRPASLGQASRISGVSPADIAVLNVFIQRELRAAKERT